ARSRRQAEQGVEVRARHGAVLRVHARRPPADCPAFHRGAVLRPESTGEYFRHRARRRRLVGDRLGGRRRYLRRQPRQPDPDALASFMDTRSLAPKGVKLIPDDLWQRACFTLSARIVRTQFHGQTKEKLTTRHAAKLMEMCVRDAFELWLNEHPDEGKKIVELTIEQAMARLSKGKKVERKKSSGIATLHGKLVDCASGDVTRNELFLVE